MHSGDGTLRRRMITRVAVVTVAVMTCMTACTESSPTPPPGTASESPPPTSASPTPTPTVDLTVPPVPPEAMGTPSADGAAAAATYFTQLYAYAYATADLTAWKAMSEPTCTFCNSLIDGVTAMVAAGETDSSAEIVVTDSFGTEIIPGESYSATLRMRQGNSERLDGAGNVVRTGDGGAYELYFALAWRDGWLVREIDTEGIEGTATP